ncbi:hypothetical protein ACM01_03885 [Streptomyces viridochromogenes]|uniref:Uncharacterized protein n=1 Tax=Streptomyces viridochromogenes TaxID=1938 RepID=A0A0J7ZNH8_STRVR|nr:hypothetical protein [Streptomyces viridochromogenes]KMS76962.1 hypothetical protein ACM01_03885 [Streptomyces viridochromogenes]
MNHWVMLPPEPSEEVLCVKAAGSLIPGTELSLVGGLLVLTNQRLYHGPLNTRPAGELLAKMAAATGPAGSAKAVSLVVAWANEARAVPLREIASVEPLKKRSLRVVGRDGKHRDFGIAASVLAPIWSSKNVLHRDEMLTAIRSALAAA